MTKQRTYSRYTTEAAQLLGQLIQLARKQHHWSEQELANRSGVSRLSVRKAEKGDLGLKLGLAFEIASIVGVPLFTADRETFLRERKRTAEILALMPKSIRRPASEIDDDF